MRRFAVVLLLAVTGVCGPTVAKEPAPRELQLSGHFTQGGMVTGTAPAGAQLRLDGAAVPVAADGAFVIGFGRDAPASAELAVSYADGVVERRRLAVRQRDYEIQRIDGLPSRMVTPSPEALKRIRAEQKLIDAARATPIAVPHFAAGFAWPVRGRISGVYGSQRILNGKPRNPHVGVDVAAPEGTLVTAPADGVVTLAQPDMYFTGKTVIVHHGLGLSSFLVHMSAILVREGQTVKKGDPIGRVGQTGRATGPHLHWGLNWRRARLDPQLVAGPMPPSAATATGSKPGQ